MSFQARKSSYPDDIEQPLISADDHRDAIADQIEAMALELRSLSGRGSGFVPSDASLLAAAKKAYAARREINRIFAIDGFSTSPGWDIMLDLYIARMNKKIVSVSSACIGAACPPTTGLRWLVVLEDMDLVRRRQDEEDRRRTLVQITEGGKIKVASALKACA